LWFEEADGIENATRVEQPAREQGIADRLNHLFEAIKNERTGEPYTNAGEVVRMSLGDLTEEEVGGIRAGTLENPTISQVLALAEAFGVHPSYFLERSKEPTLSRRAGDKRAGRPEGPRHPQQEPGSLRPGEGYVLDMIEHLGRLHNSP
jgi:hypothetical protein